MSKKTKQNGMWELCIGGIFEVKLMGIDIMSFPPKMYQGDSYCEAVLSLKIVYMDANFRNAL